VRELWRGMGRQNMGKKEKNLQIRGNSGIINDILWDIF
jgi:hypothetical protein